MKDDREKEGRGMKNVELLELTAEELGGHEPEFVTAVTPSR